MYQLLKTYGVCDVCKKPGFDLVCLAERVEFGYTLVTLVGHLACSPEPRTNTGTCNGRNLPELEGREVLVLDLAPSRHYDTLVPLVFPPAQAGQVRAPQCGHSPRPPQVEAFYFGRCSTQVNR